MRVDLPALGRPTTATWPDDEVSILLDILIYLDT